MAQLNQLLVDRGGGLAERLPQIFLFEVRILAQYFLPVAVGGEDLQGSPHGDAHSANARLAPAFAGLDRDGIEP